MFNENSEKFIHSSVINLATLPVIQISHEESDNESRLPKDEEVNSRTSQECTEDLEDVMVHAKRPRYDSSIPFEHVQKSLACDDDVEDDLKSRNSELTTTMSEMSDDESDCDSENEDAYNIIGKAEVLLCQTQEGPFDFSMPKGIVCIMPHGPLKQALQRVLIKKMFRIREHSSAEALFFVKSLMKKKQICLDLRLAALQSVVPSCERRLDILLYGLQKCDRPECKNPLILKCRFHNRLVKCYYDEGNMDKAREHAQVALQLGSQIGGDFGPVQAQLYCCFIENSVMRVPYALKGKELLEAERHYERALGMMEGLPAWMEETLLGLLMEYALLKMMIGAYYIKEGKEEEAKKSVSVGEGILSRFDETSFGPLSFAYYYGAKALMYKVRGLNELARRHGDRVIEYLNKCGCKREAENAIKLMQHFFQ